MGGQPPALLIRRAANLLLPGVILLALMGGQPGLPAADGGAPFDAQRAMALAQEFLQTAPQRGPTDSGRGIAAEWAATQLRAAGAQQIRFRVFRQGKQVWRNVEATLPATEGSERSASKPALLIGAHLDAVSGSPGALDNAAGVAIVLEATRALAKRPRARPVHLRIWDGEEAGLLGSSVDAATLEAEDTGLPAAVLVLDVVGRHDGHLVVHSFHHAWLVRARSPVPAWLARTAIHSAAEVGVPVSVGDHILSFAYQFIVHICRIPFASDDGPFLEREVPAFFFSDFSFSHPYAAYHGAEDDLRQLNVPGLARAGRALLATLASLDAASELPKDRHEDYLFLGGRALAGGWLTLALCAAILPWLPILLGAARRRWPAMLLVGYTLAVLGSPVASACVLTLPVYGAPWLARLRGRWRWALGLGLLFPGSYCTTVLLWSLAVYGTAMPVLAPPLFLLGCALLIPAWLICVASLWEAAPITQIEG